MELHYYKIDPTGNITLIVETPVPRESQPAVAASLMAQDKSAEQVGFMEKAYDSRALFRLQMMGGEFCGNATLSAAALAREKKLCDPDCDTICLEVSGAPSPLTVKAVNDSDDGVFVGTVGMPLPESCFMGEFRFGNDRYSLPVVRFPGISHVIIDSKSISEHGLNVSFAEQVIEPWCRQLGADALGLMFIDENEGLLNPYVYVTGTDTAVWESSCVSGSTAVAVYAAMKQGKSGSLTLLQPGGRIRVDVELEKFSVSSIRITGKAEIKGSFSADV